MQFQTKEAFPAGSTVVTAIGSVCRTFTQLQDHIQINSHLSIVVNQGEQNQHHLIRIISPIPKVVFSAMPISVFHRIF